MYEDKNNWNSAVEPSKVGLMISLMNSGLAFDYGQRARDFCDNYQLMLCNRTELKRVWSFAFSAIYAGNNNFKQLLINAYLFVSMECMSNSNNKNVGGK